MSWATAVGLGILAVVAAGYLWCWQEVSRQRRRYRFVTHRQQRRLARWRMAFLVAVLGSLAGAAAALLTRLLLA